MNERPLKDNMHEGTKGLILMLGEEEALPVSVARLENEGYSVCTPALSGDLQADRAALTAAYKPEPGRALGVIAAGYGAYLANWLMCTAGPFSAAVTVDGFSNLTDYLYRPQEAIRLIADTWSDMRKLWELSPLRLAPGMNTPTLFISRDTLSTQSEQLYRALLDKGIPARMAFVKGEANAATRLHLELEAVDWLYKYMGESSI